MNKKYSLFYYIFIFVMVQLIWLAIVGLWIARYVANHLILKKIGERYSVHIPYTGSVSILVIGLSLLVLAIIGMSLLFRHLNIQFKRTRMYDNFIANVTHELKTPLSSIKLYLDTIFKRDLPPEQIKKFANRMQDETSRLNELINKILDVAKIDQKEKEYSCEVRKVKTVFDEMFEELQELYNSVDIKTEIEVQSDEIIIDEEAFLSLFKNLIDNSI
ncbi:MAG TPA: HAMP domain-containing sensor histidine kinase, partial [bacterium]|nr:HAMP domain-containing sensor histidine kinase [bacterium]